MNRWMMALGWVWLGACNMPVAPHCQPAEQGTADGERDAQACDPLETSAHAGPGSCDVGYLEAYFEGYCQVHLEKLVTDEVGCGEDGEAACAEAEG
jgi:hypothetical protein